MFDCYFCIKKKTLWCMKIFKKLSVNLYILWQQKHKKKKKYSLHTFWQSCFQAKINIILTTFLFATVHIVIFCAYKQLELQSTVNFLNIQTPKIFVVITQHWTMWLYHRVMSPNDADGIANSVDPDQTALCPDLSVRKLRKITVGL